MNLRIEDVRRCLSTIATWLTFDDNTRFYNDERNKTTSEYGIILKNQLEDYTVKSRKHFNTLSESLEDVDMHRKNLRSAIEREKEIRKNRKEEKS